MKHVNLLLGFTVAIVTLVAILASPPPAEASLPSMTTQASEVPFFQESEQIVDIARSNDDGCCSIEQITNADRVCFRQNADTVFFCTGSGNCGFRCVPLREPPLPPNPPHPNW